MRNFETHEIKRTAYSYGRDITAEICAGFCRDSLKTK
jgi:hypothetical protein